jgi:hypothetical protein
MVVLSSCSNHRLDDEMGSVYRRCILGASFLHLTIVRDCERRHAAHSERASNRDRCSHWPLFYSLLCFAVQLLWCTVLSIPVPSSNPCQHVDCERLGNGTFQIGSSSFPIYEKSLNHFQPGISVRSGFW